jgi:hypothetical protein
MTRVFEGPLRVDYSQAYVLEQSENNPDMEDAFRRQTNGLCGAAVPGKLWLITGLHTGNVGFTADIFDTPPVIDDAWEEIVEVSFSVSPYAESIGIVEWEGDNNGFHPLPLEPGTYRVRYCGRGMDKGHDADMSPADGTLIDHYNLAFWPAPPADDQIIKQTSQTAAYSHDNVKNYR